MDEILDGSASLPGQGTVTCTSSAQALPATQGAELLVQADPSNTTNVLVGNQQGQPIVLQPGDSVTLSVFNANLVYVKAASGSPVANWLMRS